jgi:TonB family protein
METLSKLRKRANLMNYLVVPLIAVAILSFASCGKSKNLNESLTEIAPPPPPPPPPVSDSIYTQVDELPVFQGGDTALLGFIGRNTVYPAEAKLQKIQGKIFVKLVVMKDCSVEHVEILKGAHPLLDAEAIRVVSSLPKFLKPGIKNGEPVAVNFIIPITYALK